MFDLSEDSVAKLLTRDAQQLADRAKEIGVTAYAQKAVHRIRPNGQFLQATLRNIESGNRRVEENAMWRHHKAQLTGSREKRGAHVSSNDVKDVPDPSLHREDAAVMAFLSSKPKRGRGGVGSRVEETGPYLLESARDSYSPSSRGAEPLGPHCPDWIRLASDPAEVMSNRPQSPGNHNSTRDADLCIKSKGVGKSRRSDSKHKKQKSHKKTRVKKRHKHQQRTPEPNTAQQ
ncbi:hypothetical protein ABBQ32_012068 [Trebouxia sp. C0010 RCD-2024]